MISAIKYFTIGLFVALFFSPRTGEENRSAFADMLRNYAGSIMGKQAEMARDLGQQVGEKVPAIGKVVEGAADKLEQAADNLQ